MPYKIEKDGDKFKVVNAESGDVKGTHDTEAEAQAQIGAIEANTDEPKNDPPQHHHDDDACVGRHTALTERVDALESALNAVVQFKPDSKPVRRPWTHRGGK